MVAMMSTIYDMNDDTHSLILDTIFGYYVITLMIRPQQMLQ